MALDLDEKVAPSKQETDDEFSRIMGSPDNADLRDTLNGMEQGANPNLGDAAEQDEAKKLTPTDSNPLGYNPDDKSAPGKKKGGWGKKGGIAGAILGGLGLLSIPFLGSAALPFSILGNMNAKSMLHGLQQYADDYYGFAIFGKTSKSSVKVSITGEKLAGIRDTEMAQLKAKGVEFEGVTKTKTGRFTSERVRVNGGSWIAVDNFSEAMRDASFREAMQFQKGSLWKSAKSQAFMAIKSLFKLNSNPDLSGDTPEESGRKLVGEATDEVASTVSAPSVDGDEDPNADIKKKGAEVAGELQSQIDAEKTKIAAGTADLKALGADSDMGHVGAQMSKAGIDITDATKGLGGKLWGYVNALGPLDTVCTVYQAAYTANLLSQTLALYNIVKFGMAVVTTIERNQAGEDTDNSMSNLMTLLTQNDPTTGRAFTSSSYAAFLFNGELSSEPSSVSAFGGSSMVLLYTAMHALHSSVGELTTAGLSNDISSGRIGRAFLKTSCGVAQNLGVQLGATAASIVAAVFTGGGSGALQVTVTRGLTAGVKRVGEELVKKFGKEAIEKLVKEKGKEFVEQGFLKTAAKDSWGAARKLLDGMTTWDKLGFLMAGVSTFGMAYIVHTLSGGNVAGYTANGVSMFDAMGTARTHTDFLTGLGGGGSVATYDQASAYQPVQQAYAEAYVTDMQYAAKSTPLDIKNPYSTVGRIAYSIQQTVGTPSTNDLPSAITALATLPFKLAKASTASAADSTLTPEAIGEFIGNEYYTQNQIALTVTGSPQLIFDKNYTFTDVIAKLVDSSNPQITYDGTDTDTGEPKLSVIPGSDLANYADKCKNPNRAQLDPEFEDDSSGTSNLFDIDTCVKGGPNYKSDVYPLYDDALRFINQVTPSATGTQPLSATPAGQCQEGTTKNYGTQKGYLDGKEKDILTCGILDWPADFANSGGDKIVEVNAEIADDTVKLAQALKKTGYNYTASIGFRTNEQQQCLYDYYISGDRGCSMFATQPNPADKAGYSNHQMGYSIDIDGSQGTALGNWLDKHMDEYGFSRDVYERSNRDYGHMTHSN